ncbi:Cytochrome b(N-terminal)/b6/petB [Rivularia sp. PCC 7116]|uniref:cytochrome b/b6 domain-containing protein n=1 Tax=Rivularia sp. PCC 7116 TaxID=373994 RepID=UPI00029EF14D|nr:cytochrome b/b6 domain-containing protein [Rivularia sp. PCC 7116]AFY53840.1 Cytochrome b(N-terminal)/b6/petB [Rivularia sp. PCC 7116]
MSAKFHQPYQPLLLRILHALIGLFTIGAIITAFWTYDVFDGRWGTISLPKFTEIEGIHGTFGVWTLLIFPLFAIYAFHRGQRRLIQPDSFKNLTKFGEPMWWYSLHRLVNTLSILAVTFAVCSGKMMDEKWLPQGELNHSWYYAHLISWLILVICLALHVLMSIKVGSVPLILSMINLRFRSKDSPGLWQENFYSWRSNFNMVIVKQWLSSLSLLKVIEIFVFIAIISALVASVIKEIS